MQLALEISSTLTRTHHGVKRYTLNLLDALTTLPGADLQIKPLLRLTRFHKRKFTPAMPWPARWYISGPWPAVPGCDVFHGLDMRVPYTPNRMFRICTLHDCAYLRLGDRNPSTVKRRHRMFQHTARVAHRIIADTEASKNDFLHYYEYPAERIEVVHLGIAPIFLDDSAAAREQWENKASKAYFLAYAGDARKNLPRVISGFLGSRAAREFDLRIIGRPPESDLESLGKAAVDDRVHFLGHVDDERLAQQYRGSRGLLFPSLLEGFGLPILEAMACHAPVLTSQSGATAEVAGGHALLVDPESIAAITAGIDALCDLPDRALLDAATYARTCTWKRTAEKTLAVYRQSLE